MAKDLGTVNVEVSVDKGSASDAGQALSEGASRGAMKSFAQAPMSSAQSAWGSTGAQIGDAIGGGPTAASAASSGAGGMSMRGVMARVAIASGIVLGVVAAFKMVSNTLRSWDRDLEDAAQSMRRYSGAIAGAMARREIGKMSRGIGAAQRWGPMLGNLVTRRGVISAGMEPMQEFGLLIKAIIDMGVLTVVEAVVEGLNGMVKALAAAMLQLLNMAQAAQMIGTAAGALAGSGIGLAIGGPAGMMIGKLFGLGITSGLDENMESIREILEHILEESRDDHSEISGMNRMMMQPLLNIAGAGAFDEVFGHKPGPMPIDPAELDREWYWDNP